MHPCRKEMLDFMTEFYDTIDKTKRNSANLINHTKDMTDKEFFAYIDNVLDNDKNHFYLELEAFESNPTFDDIEKAVELADGVLFDYVVMPHMSDDDGAPFVTVEKIMVGKINMRKVQQLLNKKNNVPLDMSKRDPRTGQVTGEAKGGRVSDVEQFALLCQGRKNIIRENFGPKAGDLTAKNEMVHKIATTGSVSLSDLPNKRKNKTALNTANTFLLGAGLETDLITKKGYILLDTLESQYEGPKGLTRKGGE